MNNQRVEIEINIELLDAVQKALGTGNYSETVAQALRETILGYRPGRMTDEDREHSSGPSLTSESTNNGRRVTLALEAA